MNYNVEVLWFGAFGKAIAVDLQQIRPDCLGSPIGPATSALPTVRIRIVTSFRPIPDFCMKLAQISYCSGPPFVPLIADGLTLRLGPVIVPNNGCCWNCWTKRERQHDPWAERRDVVEQYYLKHHNQGPAGFLRPFSLLGAARLAAIIDKIDRGLAKPGYIWEINMTTLDISESVAVGVHGCALCGLKRPSTTRSYLEMRESLSYLWAREEDD